MDIVTAVGDRGHPGNGRSGSDQARGDGGRNHGASDAPFGERHAVDHVDDVALVFGMPDGAVPPPLQARFVSLMQEVERLRAELDQARRHESILREQADNHPAVPVLHRRAFLRELNRLLLQASRAEMPGSVLLVHIAGIEALREMHGLEAGEAALAHVLAVLRAECDALDPVGYLGAGVFVIALALVDEAEAALRERRLMERLAGTPFLWNGVRPQLAFGMGRAAFSEGASAEALLAAADHARPRR